MPQVGASARQTALSNSTPEAEFAAGHLAHKKAYLPALDLYDRLFPKGYHKVMHEDNQAMIQIVHTGIQGNALVKPEPRNRHWAPLRPFW